MFGSPSGQDFSRIFVGNYDFLKFREALNALFIPGQTMISKSCKQNKNEIQSTKRKKKWNFDIIGPKTFCSHDKEWGKVPRSSPGASEDFQKNDKAGFQINR